MESLLDNLSREFATATSRRRALRIFLGALAGSITSACAGITQPSNNCSNGCVGTDGRCYTCDSPTYCTRTPPSSGASCGSPSGGVYCCQSVTGGGGGGNTGGSGCRCSPGNTYNFLTGVCCPNATPEYYPGTHGIYTVGCYARCPYVGDCGSTFQRC